jgi:hypothetical protein
MKKCIIIFCSFIIIVCRLHAQTTVTGRVVTYNTTQENNKVMYYYLGLSDKHTVVLNERDEFTILIDNSKLPTTLEITGFGDQRLVEGGTIVLDRNGKRSIDLGNVYIFEKIYLEKIDANTKIEDIRIKWRTNVDIGQEMWIEVLVPQSTFGEWETLLQYPIGEALAGDIKLAEIDGAIEKIDNATNKNIYICVVGYLRTNKKLVRVVSSDSWLINIQ